MIDTGDQYVVTELARILGQRGDQQRQMFAGCDLPGFRALEQVLRRLPRRRAMPAQLRYHLENSASRLPQAAD